MKASRSAAPVTACYAGLAIAALLSKDSGMSVSALKGVFGRQSRVALANALYVEALVGSVRRIDTQFRQHGVGEGGSSHVPEPISFQQRTQRFGIVRETVLVGLPKYFVDQLHFRVVPTTGVRIEMVCT
jgi:hypothetical protein